MPLEITEDSAAMAQRLSVKVTHAFLRKKKRISPYLEKRMADQFRNARRGMIIANIILSWLSEGTRIRGRSGKGF